MAADTMPSPAIMQRPADHGPAPVLRLVLLAGIAVVAVVAYLTIGALDAWSLIAPLRLPRVAAMVLVGLAIAVSTVLFQTVTENRILTPSIMGFDSLYALIQTGLIFVLGSTTVIGMPPMVRFGVELTAMMLFSAVLYRWIFGGPRRSLYLLVLVGIVFGTLFRSLSAFMQRVIDPNEFLIVQDRLFASFNGVSPTLLAVGAAVLALCLVVVWTMRRDLDVLALGRDTALALGVDHQRKVLRVLALCALLVSVSTALVGPITFFGLLVANLAYLLMGTHRHAYVLPGAALLAVVTLVGGQTILEHGFGLDTVLSVIIEFAGGIVFIALLVRGGKR